MDQAARVQRLRVPGHTGSPDRATQQVRQQVTRWLESQTPTRLGLPAEAIVVLRSIRAPWSALHPDSPADVLRQRLRNAIRPATGAPMGAGCDAVWFADEAELLACLARDSVLGQVGQRWWWQTWLGHRPAGGDALQAWLNAARRAPAAMVRLSGMGQGLAWARHMGVGGRLALLQALQRHHPLAPSASDWLPRVLSDGRLGALGNEPNAIATETTGARRDAEAARHSSPWSDDHVWAGWAGSDGASVLLALCTLLHEAPHLTLDEGELAMRLQLISGMTNAQRSPASSLDARHRRDALPTAAPFAREAANLPSQAAHHAGEDAASLVRPNASRAPEASPRTLADTTSDAVAPDAHMAAAEPEASTTAAPASRPGSSSASRPPQPDRLGAIALEAFKQTTTTAHGGVFFLLNVALAWELYGDFTRPRHALLSVSPWQFLHASAFALLGRAFAADPLAGWLRAQAPFSRPRPRPASALDGAPLSLLPPTEANKLRSATASIGTSAPSRLATAPHRAARPVDELSTWWPLLRQRLSLALNLPEREAIATCLNLPARVERRGDRVDVGFSLHHLPLAIRLAGLDRDPGWVPASGCDVRFHFEA